VTAPDPVNEAGGGLFLGLLVDRDPHDLDRVADRVGGALLSA
jgi:hypothetical protein